MKFFLLFIVCHLSFSLCSQISIGKPWTIECGASTNNFFIKSRALHLRYISPRFNWSNEELTEEQEKDPLKFKKNRVVFELIYTPALKVLGAGINAQYCFVKYKKFTLEVSGGLKYFFVSWPDSTTKSLKKIVYPWYLDIGLIAKFNLGAASPFIIIGDDGILTIGSEFRFRAIFRRPGKRYNLHLKEA